VFLRSVALLDELGVDVGENSTGSDGDLAQELVQLLVVSDSELNVSGDDSHLLALLSGVSGEFQDLSDHVLQHGGEVHGSARTDSAGVSAVLQESSNSANRELKTSLGTLRAGSSFLSSFAATSFSFSRHY
jgi:hypothetical protein